MSLTQLAQEIQRRQQSKRDYVARQDALRFAVHRHTRSSAFTDGRHLADLWLREPGRRGDVLRQVEDRIIVDRAAGMMLLLALQHWLGHTATTMVDDIQAHLAPDME